MCCVVKRVKNNTSKIRIKRVKNNTLKKRIKTAKIILYYILYYTRQTNVLCSETRKK